MRDRMTDLLARPILFVALNLLSIAAWAGQCCDPEGPFAPGEGFPEEPATCETVKHWIDRAPTEKGRISFGIKGELVAAEWDGALAYLIMCQEHEVQVMCVTYSKEGKNVGDTLYFGGGYRRVGERQVMLDPCLTGAAD